MSAFSKASQFACTDNTYIHASGRNWPPALANTFLGDSLLHTWYFIPRELPIMHYNTARGYAETDRCVDQTEALTRGI